MDFHQGPLAEALIEYSAQGPLDGVAYRFVIAARSGRQLIDGALDGAAQSRCGRVCSAPLDHSDHAHSHRCREPSLPIQYQSGDCGTVEGNAAAVPQRGAVQWKQASAVAGESADRHLVDDARSTRGEPNYIAVLDYEGLLDLARLD